MQLTQKLLTFLNGVFDKDAQTFRAFDVVYTSGAFNWAVTEEWLYGYDGTVTVFAVDLSLYTIGDLIAYLQTVPGVQLPYTCGAEFHGRSARVLLDGTGSQIIPGGNTVLGYTSLLWAYMEALSEELEEARQQILTTVAQMDLHQSDDEWTGVWGGFFGVYRFPGEALRDYAQRIIDDTIRPRGNNKGMELALRARFGQTARVLDLTSDDMVVPRYNNVYTFNASLHYDSIVRPYYGLFQIAVGYDLLGSADPTQFVADVTAYTEKIRHAGTHLRSVNLGASIIMDTLTAPLDVLSPFAGVVPFADALTEPTDATVLSVQSAAVLADSLTTPTESTTATVTTSTHYNGLRRFNGMIPYASGSPAVVILV